MEKFNSKKHLQHIRRLPFAYLSLPVYLDCFAYVFERNGELVIVSQDIYFPHEFPVLFLPQKKENWQYLTCIGVTETQLEQIEGEHIDVFIKKKIGQEYYYKTEVLLDPKKKIGQRIRQFQKNYQYTITHTYSKKAILDFYYVWKQQKERNGDLFEESEIFFLFCLDNLKKYKIKQDYIQNEQKELIGFAWGVEHTGGWIGLHLKVDYRYKGLSMLLHHERAKMFSHLEHFSLGTGAKEAGISQFKKELGPYLIQDQYYIATRRIEE